MSPTRQVPQGSYGIFAVQDSLLGEFVHILASGAMNPRLSGRFLIDKAGVAAMTLAAPNLGDDGMYLRVISTTANAHTITATGLFQDGAGHVNLATFAAQIGASVDLMALAGKWVVIRVQGVTMS
jgi:hypothetical protein